MSFRAMSGIIQSTNYNKGSESERKSLFNELMAVIKECQKCYGGKTELATEHDPKIVRLCDNWETVLSHGLRNNASMLRNVSDLVSGTNSEPNFWEFAYQHLTTHEKERFSTLRHVWTDRGKGRALIRAALNERALERYVLIWLSDNNLRNSYEGWALIRDEEISFLLSSLAAGLSAILFAISVDCPELNVSPKQIETRPEPVIALPIPVGPKKKATTIERQIMSFNEKSPLTSPTSYGSAPKSLSSLCLKYEGPSTSQADYIRIAHKIEEHSIQDQILVSGEPEAPSAIHMFSLSEEYLESIAIPQNDSSVKEASESSIISSSSQDSSIRGSTGSVTSEQDIVTLKARLAEQEERCSWLEARVAELSLENHRLRGQSNSRNQTYFTVSIPRVIVQKTGVSKYYAYEIHIIPTHGGDEFSVLRRYSDFHRLHKKYQKDNVSVQTLDFPPKKKFGNMNCHFVEQRRQRLQVYLRHLISILPEVSACTTREQLQKNFPFL